MVETKHLLIGSVVAYLIVLGMFFSPFDEPGPGQPGTAHAHLYFAVTVDGERVDFSQERYQLQDRRVHFENRDGEVLHVHARQVTVGYTLRSLGIGVNESCIAVNGSRCANSTHDLRVYVDGDVIDEPWEYVLRQGDNVMVWYGPAEDSPPTGFFQRELPDAYRPGESGEGV